MLKKQLLRVADMLSTIPLKEWNMARWKEITVNEAGDVCGTVGCAIGTAVVRGIAPKRLCLVDEHISPSDQKGWFYIEDKRSGARAFDAVSNAYHIPTRDAAFLFGAHNDGYTGKDSRGSVARRIRHFVKTGEIKI